MGATHRSEQTRLAFPAKTDVFEGRSPYVVRTP